MTSKAELKTKYSYVLDGSNIGNDLYVGWLPTLVAACNAVDKLLGTDKASFRFSQIKEKYGSARIYWTSKISDKDVEKAITRLLNDVKKAIESICIVCGAPAELKKYNSWVACLCDVRSRISL